MFDHHDLCPETFESRFPEGSPVLYRGLRFLERRTVRLADHVISTNESYRRLVIDRDGVKPGKVTVVRTGPDPDKLKAAEAVPSLRRGRAHLAAYIGVMGPQDGVDIVIKMADFVVNTLKRTDISFTLIGSGDCFDELVALRDQLKLGDFVEFTGRAPDEAVRDILSTADIGLSPDPKNPLNDVSTMNKTMEYMAFGLPVLAFDLRETRASAAEAGAYATPNDVEEMARMLVELIDDEPRRRSMGSAGRRRIEQKLAWSHQEPHYLSVYDRLLGREPDTAARGRRPCGLRRPASRRSPPGKQRRRARQWSRPDAPQVPSPPAQKRAGSRARVAWYVRRLQCMSPQEVLWRSSDVLRQRAWRLRQVPTATAPPSPGPLGAGRIPGEAEAGQGPSLRVAPSRRSSGRRPGRRRTTACPHR